MFDGHNFSERDDDPVRKAEAEIAAAEAHLRALAERAPPQHRKAIESFFVGSRLRRLAFEARALAKRALGKSGDGYRAAEAKADAAAAAALVQFNKLTQPTATSTQSKAEELVRKAYAPWRK